MMKVSKYKFLAILYVFVLSIVLGCGNTQSGSDSSKWNNVSKDAVLGNLPTFKYPFGLANAGT